MGDGPHNNRHQEPRIPREDLLGAYSAQTGVISDDPLAALANNIPGVPGEDYPIYADVPELPFSCDGQVNGGEFTISL